MTTGTYNDCEITFTPSLGFEDNTYTLTLTPFVIEGSAPGIVDSSPSSTAGTLSSKLNAQKSDGKYPYGTKIKLAVSSGSVDYIYYKWKRNDDWKLYDSPFKAKEGKNRLYYKGEDLCGNEVFSKDKILEVRKADYLKDLTVVYSGSNARLKWKIDNSLPDKVTEVKILRSFETQDNWKDLGNNVYSDSDYTDTTITNPGMYYFRIEAHRKDGLTETETAVFQYNPAPLSTIPYLNAPVAAVSGAKINAGDFIPKLLGSDVLAGETKAPEIVIYADKDIDDLVTIPPSTNKPKLLDYVLFIIAPSIVVALLIRHIVTRKPKRRYFKPV
jgi:hypothetical protein